MVVRVPHLVQLLIAVQKCSPQCSAHKSINNGVKSLKLDVRCILAQSFCSKTYVEYAVVGFIRAVVGLPLWVPCYSKKTLLRTQTSCALGQGQLPSTETFNGGSVLNPPPYYLRCPLCIPPGAADALPPPPPPTLCIRLALYNFGKQLHCCVGKLPRGMSLSRMGLFALHRGDNRRRPL